MSPAPGTLVVDADHGRLLLRAADQSDLVSVPVDSHGAVDDARAWVAAIDEIAASERTAISGLSSVVVRASEVGLVCVGVDGTDVHPISWADDDRSAPDAAWCRKKHDDAWWESEVGMVPEYRNLVTKLSLVHRSAPDAWERARFFCSVEDYLRWHLVSTNAPGSFITRPKVAATFGLWRLGGYRAAVLSLIDADRNWSGVLPEVGIEGTVLGTWCQLDVRL